MIITEPTNLIAAWVGHRIGCEFRPPYTAIGCLIDGRIVGAAVFNMWTKFDIECSVATSGRIPRELMKACRDYAEKQLGVTRITFRTKSDNVAAQNVLVGLGAHAEGIQHGYFGDVDGLLYGLILSESKFGR